MLNCEVCGTPFKYKVCGRNKARFCSQLCKQRYKTKLLNEKNRPLIKKGATKAQRDCMVKSKPPRLECALKSYIKKKSLKP